MIYLLVLAVGLAAVGLNGCSTEEDGTGPGNGASTDLTIEDVILDPKSPAPGDTLLATAVVAMDSTFTAGFVSYAWSATGGVFLETNLSTVRWVAPSSSTVFVLTVRVSNGSTSKTSSREVFVSEIVPLVSSGAGEMRLSSTGDSLFYFSSSIAPGQSGFWGFGVNRIAGGINQNLLGRMGPFQIQVRVNPRLAKVAFVVPGGFGALQVGYRNFLGPTTFIPLAPLIGRLPQYTEPDFSPDDSLLTYQLWLPDWMATPAQGGVDTFVVATWDLTTQTEKRIAVGGVGSGAYGLNFHPGFSNDGRHLVYMADPNGSSDWELYALPVSGRNIPVDTSTTPIQLTFSGGIMGRGVPPASRPRVWNPVTSIPILATVDVDTKLRLVPTDGSGDVLVLVPGLAREFVWMASGQDLLLSTGVEIYRVTRTGNPTLVHRAASGDNLSRVSSSSDGRLLLYAVTRLSDVWYEVVDLTGTLGLSGPLRVTPSSGPGQAVAYSAFGSNAPVWSRSEPKAYMLFFNTGLTPRICTMDFSGLYP